MTQEQERIAEQVIQKYKDNDGIYDWKDFKVVFNTTDEQRLIISKTLRELNIICDHLNNRTRLTETGWNFKGFENERKSKRQKEDRQKKIEELTLRKLKLEQFPAKFWWLIIIITAVISFLTTWVNNQLQQSVNQQEMPKSEIPLQK
jgi:hypothetical protein